MFDTLTSLKMLKWIIRAAILLIAGVTVWMWADPGAVETMGIKTEVIARYGGIGALSPLQRALGFAIDALPAGLLIAALWLLLRLLGQIEQGRWRDQAPEATCTAMGRMMLYYIGASILNHTLLVLLLTFEREDGKRELAIALSSDNLLGLIPALMAFVIAQLLRLAREQREELDEIV